MLKQEETAVFMLAGKIIMAFGIVGVVITIFFDTIARGFPVFKSTFGWLQVVGMIVFSTISLFGVYVDVFLNEQIKPMIEDYLRR